MRSRHTTALVALFALSALAWAARGIEVLEERETVPGIEVLARAAVGGSADAEILVAGDWVTVDTADADEGGIVVLHFALGLEAGACRIVARDSDGGVLDTVVYDGGGWE